MAEVDNMPLDDHASKAPLGDYVDPVAQPNGDAAKTPARRRQE